ncbi:MAG: OadG family protein [Methylobacter sp.]|uniref:OadG family protein n=1 Tax=Methylobacter sp. TaxID=2051955 RepID=UPI002589CD32|nr:OadG family transporter subunit [Methylobacter sp.]MCL7420362.1 OadG family protein [Methylobacter sp.]
MTELMTSGIELMMVGMGLVFLFLAMLVLAINLMSALVQRYFPDAPPATAAGRPAGGGAGVDAGVIAAIAAAVHQYRTRPK